MIIGAGITGIATAYYLNVEHGMRNVLLVDRLPPMSYTSAQSGDNYRNWWPHPVMTAFTNDSIDLMRALARETEDAFNMSSRGYALATRRGDIGDLVDALQVDVDVDVVTGRQSIRRTFSALSEDIAHVLHIRNAGDISGQQLGAVMLERIREAGGSRLRGNITAIDNDSPFVIEIHRDGQRSTLLADTVVNAAGPFVGAIAGMLDYELPVTNVFQQKVAFEDDAAAVPRDMPFTIDLDTKHLGWSDEEAEQLAADPDLEWLTREMPAGTHCRPDGPADGKWVKLGWAYNETPSEPLEDMANEAAFDATFPEIVIRGAAQLIPALEHYIESPPLRYSHYGGYYTMTEENWPLIGPAGPRGSYVVGALSGFGSMSACAAGKICAAWICGAERPDYARDLSLARYEDASLIDELRHAPSKGLL